MSRLVSFYICQQCGFRTSQFLGKCPECGSWNSLVEQVEESQESRVKSQGNRAARLKTLGTSDSLIINLNEVEKENFKRVSCGMEEFDRVLGGGIVPGSVVLVSGDPGIGKSTLLLQLALGMKRIDNSVQRTVKTTIPYTLNAMPCLYVSGEESAHQIKIRAERIKPQSSLAILNETDVDVVVEVIKNAKLGLAIIDSIQTMETEDLSGVAGSVGQVRECAHRLQQLAKSLHIPIFLVGHVTKDGSIAGPKTLEHLVDVVLSLEGDLSSGFRILRSSKNRFGPTDEVGIFEMEEGGMTEVKNPSKLFLENKIEAPGSVVTVSLNGLRPILVEIQALVTKSFLPQPRRVGIGIDSNRLQLLVAVLSKRLKLPLFDADIFVNVTGGLKLLEPATDLAVCLAIISSLQDKILKPKTVLMGEVGLLGELRPVRQLSKRVSEAKKLGFSKIISPDNVKTLSQAVGLALNVDK